MVPCVGNVQEVDDGEEGYYTPEVQASDLAGSRDHDLYSIPDPEAALTFRTRSTYGIAPILNLSLLPVLSLRVRVPSPCAR